MENICISTNKNIQNSRALKTGKIKLKEIVRFLGFLANIYRFLTSEYHYITLGNVLGLQCQASTNSTTH